MKILQAQVNLTDQVAYIKNHLWTKIIEVIHSQWPSIRIIYEPRELLQVSSAEINKTKREIDNKLAQAIQLIAFLNSKNREELEELKIVDRTETILQIKKVLNKRNIMSNLEDRCKDMNLSISRFLAKYKTLSEAGLPDIHALNDKLMPQKYYDLKIRTHAKEKAKQALS